MRALLMHPIAKPLLWLACAAPAAWLAWAVIADRLGANPAEALQHSTGLWALRLLCLTLAVTPLRIHGKTPQLARFRRSLGLAAFAYACLHVLCYVVFDMEFDWAAVARDIPKRPFILVGFLTWILLLPLAATSFNRAMRWLGGRRWKALHRLIYLVAGLALLHFFWMRAGKNHFGDVGAYAVVIAVLLLERVVRAGLRLWRECAPRLARRRSEGFELP